MENTSRKIAYLDGIRGVAALCVLLHHFLLIFYSAFYTFDTKATNCGGWDVRFGQSVFSFLSNGNFCVGIFFVLSGYVLSRKYFATNSYMHVVAAAQRRYLRLFIPVAFVLGLAYIFTKAGVFSNAETARLSHSEWWFGGMWHLEYPTREFLKSITYSTILLGDNTLVTSTWTLTIELYGSLIVFAFLALTHNSRARGVMLLVLAAAFLACEQFYYASFLAGISLNYIERWKHAEGGKILKALLVAVFIPTALVLGSYPTSDAIKGTFFEHIGHTVLEYGHYFHSVGAYLLLIAFVLSGVLQRIFSMRLFRFLGYISFSIYLLHPLVFGLFSSALFLKLYGHLPYNQVVAIVFAATLAVSSGLAWLMAKYVDGPGTRFAQYVYDRWCRPVSQEKA